MLAAVARTGEKAIHLRSGKTLAQWVKGTLCNKPLRKRGGERGKGAKEGGGRGRGTAGVMAVGGAPG